MGGEGGQIKKTGSFEKKVRDQERAEADEIQLEQIRRGGGGDQEEREKAGGWRDPISVRDHTVEWTKLGAGLRYLECLWKALSHSAAVCLHPDEGPKVASADRRNIIP